MRGQHWALVTNERPHRLEPANQDDPFSENIHWMNIPRHEAVKTMEPDKTSQLISIVLSNPNSRWPCPHGSLRGDESTNVKTWLLVQTFQSEKEFRMAGKKRSGDWLKRLAAVILLVKFCCLLQNVIYPPPLLEAFNVDHKLGRTSGAAKDIFTTTKQSKFWISSHLSCGDM